MPESTAFPLLCEELLRSGQTVRFRATGSSMGPAIRDGDVVTIVPVDAEIVRRGEVILYSSERGLTAHRVIGFRSEESAFVTQGDSPGSPLELVREGALLGRVEFVARDGISVPFGKMTARHFTRLIGLIRKIAKLAQPGADREVS